MASVSGGAGSSAKGKSPWPKKPSKPSGVTKPASRQATVPNPFFPAALSGQTGVSGRPGVKQLIDTYHNPVTGVGKPVNKLPLSGNAPRSAARPIAAKKIAAPIIAAGGSTPRPPVGLGGGGGRTPATSAPSSVASSSNAAVGQKQAQAKSLADYMSTASDAVKAELQPALNELNRQIAEMGARGAKATSETSARGARAEADLAELFGRLGNFTGEIQKTQNANYEGLKGNMGTTYDTLKAALGTTYDGAQAASATEANRLGLGQLTGAPEAHAGMERDQQYLQNLAGVDKNAAVNGLAQSQNSFDQLMTMARGTAATEGAVRVGQSRRDTNQALSDIAFELEQGTRGLEGKRFDIEEGRGSKIKQLVDALQDRDYNRQVDTEDRQFQRDLATKKYGLEERQVNAAMAPQEASQDDILNTILLQQKVEAGMVDPAQALLGTGPTYRIDPRTGRRIISGTGNKTPGVPKFTPNR